MTDQISRPPEAAASHRQQLLPVASGGAGTTCADHPWEVAASGGCPLCRVNRGRLRQLRPVLAPPDDDVALDHPSRARASRAHGTDKTRADDGERSLRRMM